MHPLPGFLQDEEGVTAIEYGLLAAFIALAIIAASTSLGTEIAALLGKVTTKLAGVSV